MEAQPCRTDGSISPRLFIMKKLENFSNCLNVLKNADFDLADNNDIYRTGVIGQFNLTIELAWKALQEIKEN